MHPQGGSDRTGVDRNPAIDEPVMGAGLCQRGASGTAEQHVEGSGDIVTSSRQERWDRELIRGGSDAAVAMIVTESQLESGGAKGRRECIEWWGDRKLVNGQRCLPPSVAPRSNREWGSVSPAVTIDGQSASRPGR
jgi:hypothetical protein